MSASLTEGNPNAVLEAMGGGCPVVLSDIAAHREVADGDSVLFFPPHDEAAALAALQSVVANGDASAARAAQARARCERRGPSWAAEQYDELYRCIT